MKRQVVTLALLADLLTAVNLGRAADEKAPKPETTAPARNRDRVQQRLKEVSEKLALTDAQKTKVKAVFQKEGEKLRALRQDTSLDPQERRKKAMELREETRKEMKTILTADQWEKWEKMRQEARGGGRARGRGSAQ